MLEIIKALLAGIVLGGVFQIINLPIPAPNKVAGIAGIVGIFLGYILIEKLKQ